MAEKMLLSHFPSVFYTKWTKLDLKDDATVAVVVLMHILLMGAHGTQKDVHIHAFPITSSSFIVMSPSS